MTCFSWNYSYRSILWNLCKQFLCTAEAPRSKETDNVLINLQNGTLEVSENGFVLREHQRENFLTYQLQFAFDEKAHRPLFDNYLQRVLPNSALQMIPAEYIAYCFTQHLKLEKCLFLYRTGANGNAVGSPGANTLLITVVDGLSEQFGSAIVRPSITAVAVNAITIVIIVVVI